jgi:hypothetical protein
VWVKHDGAVLDFAIFLKQASDVGFAEARMDTSHEEICAGVDSLVFVLKSGDGISDRRS